MVERCVLSGSGLNIKFRAILLTSITQAVNTDPLHSSWDRMLQIGNLQLRNLSMAFLRGFPDGSNIGSTVYCRGEGHNIWVNSMMSGRRTQEGQRQRQYSTPSSIVLGNIGSAI